MMVRRTLDGALKCALRDFLLEAWRSGSVSIAVFSLESLSNHTGVDLGHFGGWGVVSCR